MDTERTLAMTIDTNPTARFFSPAQKELIIQRFNGCCAACGSRDQDILEADHWIAYNGRNTIVANGVALCAPCNRVKARARIPGKPIAPRAPIKAITIDEYFLQVQKNRAAFAAWAGQYRSTGKCAKKATPYIAPY